MGSLSSTIGRFRLGRERAGDKVAMGDATGKAGRFSARPPNPERAVQAIAELGDNEEKACRSINRGCNGTGLAVPARRNDGDEP